MTATSEQLFRVEPPEKAPVDRHWFVPDATGHYCEACSLPEGNRRHAPRRSR